MNAKYAYLRNRANILYKSCSAISLPTYQIIELPNCREYPHNCFYGLQTELNFQLNGICYELHYARTTRRTQKCGMGDEDWASFL